MKPDTDQTKAPGQNPGGPAKGEPDASASKQGTKPDAKPDPNNDLKTLPMPEVEKKLGSSAEGLTQAEAQKRLTQ